MRFTDVFGVGATGDQFIPPRQLMARIGIDFKAYYHRNPYEPCNGVALTNNNDQDIRATSTWTSCLS